jgi:hypothetical protein
VAKANYALVLIDGFPANDPGGEFDFGKLLPLELERVEVTRGAALLSMEELFPALSIW